MTAAVPSRARRLVFVGLIAGVTGAVPVAAEASGPERPNLDVAAATAVFSLETTVMIDDGTDSCGTDTAIAVVKGTMLRFCYTLMNTGDEALNLHDVRDSHIGQIAGPDFDQLVAPGEGLALTATWSHDVSTLHHVSWDATGADSGTVVDEFDGLFVTILGPEITLDMTVMVDDGHETCGTETELSVPAGTQVRYCYTMTDTGDEPVNYHYLNDDPLGVLLSSLDREVEPGESLMHTEVAAIDATVTNIAHWGATAQNTGADVESTDSVTVEIIDPDATTTTMTTSTTTTVAGPGPCATNPPVVTASPTTPLPTDATTTTTASTTTTATTTATTTSTTLPTFTTTTSTTTPILVLLTTTLGEPAGFAGRPLDRPDVAPCPTAPPGDGGQLPATGSPSSALVALAALAMASGGVALVTARRRRS